MKRILVIGAGFLQTFVIKKAKEMGYYTIAIDKNPNSVGFEYADEYSAVDIIDEEACLRFALSKNIDGVITVATDYGVLSTAYIAQQMNLPGLHYEIAKMIKNKYVVRRTLFQNTVDDISQYYEVSNMEAINTISKTIHFPVMVKPCDGSGSKAARKANSIKELKEACGEAIKSSLIGKALVEDFIEGEEYGVESFVHEGEIHVLGIMNKYMTEPPDYAELGHSIPCQLEVEEKIKEVVSNAIGVLGINFGAVNMDVLVTKDNRVCIVDVGARMGGNLIGSHIIPLGKGIDYMGNLIQAAVGDSVDLRTQDSYTSIATRLLALKPGKVIGLPNFNEIEKELGVNIYHNLKLGSVIRKYRNNSDGCGYVVSAAHGVKEAIKRAEEAKRLVDIGVVRE